MWIEWTATNNSNAAAFLSNLHFCLRLSFCPESDPRLIPGPCVHHGVRAGVGIAALSSARLLSKHFKWQNVASRVKQYFSTKIYIMILRRILQSSPKARPNTQTNQKQTSTAKFL